jgi:hypothetical protein
LTIRRNRHLDVGFPIIDLGEAIDFALALQQGGLWLTDDGPARAAPERRPVATVT